MSRGVVSAMVGSTAGWVLGGPLFGVLVGSTIALVSAALRRHGRSRERRARRDAVPVALDLLVLAGEAGLTPHETIELLARVAPRPIRPAFDAVAQRTRRGDALADALGGLPDAIGPEIVAASDAVALAQRHGAPLGDALHVIRGEAARQRRVHAEAAARRLPVLLSFPLVSCILPAFVLLAVAPAVVAALSSLQTSGW